MFNYGYGGIFGLLILIGDIWAIINILQSSASTEKKVLWIVLVVVLPLLGLILWLLQSRTAWIVRYMDVRSCAHTCVVCAALDAHGRPPGQQNRDAPFRTFAHSRSRTILWQAARDWPAC